MNGNSDCLHEAREQVGQIRRRKITPQIQHSSEKGSSAEAHHITSSAKQSRQCYGSRSLVLTADRNCGMNSEVYRSILSAQIQINPAKQMRWRFTAQRDLRTAKAPKKLLKAKKWDILQWPSQSPDFNPREYDFQLLETNLKAERLRNQQQLKVAAVMGLADHLRGETKHLVMSMTVIDSII